jgi:hypothetical protein
MSRFPRIVFGCVCLMLALAVPAVAQRQTGTVLENAPIFIKPGAQTPLRVAAVGTVLEILGTEGAWLNVRFQDPQFGLRVGYVEAKLVQRAAPPSLEPTDLSIRPSSPQQPPQSRVPAAATAERPSPVASPPPPAQRPTPPSRATGPVLTFHKVDYAQVQGDKERSRDARLVLDPGSQTLVFADEGDGEAKEVFARIPYAAITKIVYERSAHRRYGAGVLVSPLLFFTKGKKHWLTVEFQNVAELPQGFVYARLDKDNFRQILSALRAGTGVTVEEHIEND